MQRAEKSAVVEQMLDNLQRAAGSLFLDFSGMTVAEADSFRSKLRESNLEYIVVKNTLLTRALNEETFTEAADCLKVRLTFPRESIPSRSDSCGPNWLLSCPTNNSYQWIRSRAVCGRSPTRSPQRSMCFAARSHSADRANRRNRTTSRLDCRG